MNYSTPLCSPTFIDLLNLPIAPAQNVAKAAVKLARNKLLFNQISKAETLLAHFKYNLLYSLPKILPQLYSLLSPTIIPLHQ